MIDEARYALKLRRGLRQEIEANASTGYPNESCGLLIGGCNGDETVVEHMTAALNLDSKRPRDRYVLDPDDFARADRLASARGLDVVGIWHSHPDHPAEPSQTDLEAAWPRYSYVIVSVTKGSAGPIRSWRLANGRFEEERLEL